MKLLKDILLPSIKLLLIMTLLTGFIYPGIITLTADMLFRDKAGGSILKKDGVATGSELIGQKFDSNKYFHSRPSANNYNALLSGGSNYGPLNPLLQEKTSLAKDAFIDANYLSHIDSVPPEMITASASGLDPHITPEAAILQIDRIIHNRYPDTLNRAKIIELIRNMTEPRQFYILGEPRINVFVLNLRLDSIK